MNKIKNYLVYFAIAAVCLTVLCSCGFKITLKVPVIKIYNGYAVFDDGKKFSWKELKNSEVARQYGYKIDGISES